MRTHTGTWILAIAVVVVVAFAIRGPLPTHAKQQLGGVSIDPFALTGTTTNLPQAHYQDFETVY
jgi:hypothetical protein